MHQVCTTDSGLLSHATKWKCPDKQFRGCAVREIRKEGYLLYFLKILNSVADQGKRSQMKISVWGQLEFLYNFGMVIFMPLWMCTRWLLFKPKKQTTAILVGRCLATKFFLGNLSYQRGIGHHRVGQKMRGDHGQQTSCKILIGVHEMHGWYTLYQYERVWSCNAQSPGIESTMHLLQL